jgi:hypothetical protein
MSELFDFFAAKMVIIFSVLSWFEIDGIMANISKRDKKPYFE